jgi:hypothetical protein
MKHSLALLIVLMCPSPEPPPDLVPGKYIMTLDKEEYPATLGKNGEWEWKNNQIVWSGTYKWDAKNRKLEVTEWAGKTKYHWSVKLDDTLSGKFDCPCGRKHMISFKKRKKE